MNTTSKSEKFKFVAEMTLYYSNKKIIKNKMAPCLVKNYFKKDAWQNKAAFNYCNELVKKAVIYIEPVWGKTIVRELCF